MLSSAGHGGEFISRPNRWRIYFAPQSLANLFRAPIAREFISRPNRFDHQDTPHA
jgi:hypothetical protein